MKKILFIALAMAAVLVFVQFYRFTALGELGYSALSLPDENFIAGLKGEADEDASVLTPDRIGPFDILYERAGALYAGADKTKLNRSLPLFANDATALLSIGDSLRLVTEDFERLPAYYGLLVSDGRSFNADMTPADPFGFILVQMKNNVFGNAVSARVESENRVSFIPMNSLMYHTPDSISYYAHADGKFVLRRVDGLSADSRIVFGDRSYGYHEYLRRLGLLPDVRPVLPPDLPEWPAYELASAPGDRDGDADARARAPAPPREGEGADGATPPDEAGVAPNADPPEPKPPEKPKSKSKPAPETPEEYGPFLSLGKFRGDYSPPYRNDYTAEARLRIYDPNKALTGAVRVYLTLTVFDKVYEQRWRTRDFGDADRIYVYRTVKFKDLEWGATYEAWGEYDYYDKDGVLRTERFGEQKFKIEAAKEPPEAPEGPAPEGEYRKPSATAGEFAADVYEIAASAEIDDPDGHIAGGLRFELKSGGKLFRRMFVTESGPFDIKPVRPDTEYEIVAYFDYIDAEGNKVRENLFEQPVKVRTLPIESITPLTLRATPGDLYSHRLEMKDICLDQDESKGRTPAGKSVLPYADKILFVADGRTSALPPDAKRAAVLGNPAVFATADAYESNKSYQYEMRVLDIYGNELPLDPKVAGTIFTCKAPPAAAVKAAMNAVADIRLDIAVTDKDAAALASPNRRLTVYREVILSDGTAERAVVTTDIRRSDGSTESGESHFVSENESVALTNLPAGEAFIAVITCDYDLGDGKGAVTDGEIGSLKFVTSGIQGLGKLVLNVPRADLHVSASAVGMNVLIDRNATNETLTFLLSEVTLTARPTDPESGADTRTRTFASSDPNFHDWTTSAGAVWTALFAPLQSKTEYELSAAAKVTLGGVEYEVPATIDLEGFKTLLRPAYVLVGGQEITDVAADPPPAPPLDRTPAAGTYFIASNSIDLFGVSVVDEDGAIAGDGKAMLIVTNEAGGVVYSQALIPTPPNEEPVQVSLNNLEFEHKYNFSILAAEYNEGHDLSTMRFNKELDRFGLETRPGLSGSVRLHHMVESASAQRAYDATFTVDLEDLKGEIREIGGGAYHLRLQRLGYDGKVVKTDVHDIPYDPPPDETKIREEIELYELPERADYLLELYIELGAFKKTLGSIAFDTQGRVESIATMRDFRKITENDYKGYLENGVYRGGKNGRYVVVADLLWNSLSGDNSLAGGNMGSITSDAHFFEGTIDFQGYSMTVDLPGRRFLFWTMGGNGVIKNGVFNFNLQGSQPVGEFGLLIHRNRGTVRDVQVNVKGNNGKWNNGFGVIACDNAGIIENFVVNYEAPVSARTNFGVVYSNTGTVRNGYVYAPNGPAVVVPDLPGNSGSTDLIGGIVAYNNLKGLVENVYSLVDIRIEGGTSLTLDNNGARFGTLVGDNAGTVRSAYSSGQVYYEEPRAEASGMSKQPDPTDPSLWHDLAHGPGVGRHTAKYQTEVYYYSGDDESKNTYSASYNTRVMSNTLRREDWQSSVLGAGFDAANTVPMGYYPHVRMSAVMPPQKYISLPGTDADDAPEIVNALVEAQREDYAVVALTLKNQKYKVFRELQFETFDPGNGPVPTVDAMVLGPNMTQAQTEYLKNSLELTPQEIAALGARVQIDRDGLSRVWVLLSNPKKFYSRYRITEFTVSAGATSTLEAPHTVPNGGFPVDAEFFKPIHSVGEWKNTIVTETGNANPENYRLKADLDFTNIGPADIRVGKTMADATKLTGNDFFAGKLDGGVYDRDMHLVGVHSLQNIKINESGAQGGGVFAFLTGTVSNLLVENLTIDAQKNTYVGFVRVLYGGGALRNVRLKDISYEGPASDRSGTQCFLGGLVARQYYGEVADSSVSGATLTADARNIAAGGLTGALASAKLRNSWVDGLELNITGGIMALGVGGVAGFAENSDLLNLYAEGRIESADQHTGGIIGDYPAGSVVQGTWNKVNIHSMTDRLGGVAGTLGSSSSLPLNSLALGDLSSAAARFTGTAAGDAIHRIAGNGLILRAGADAVARLNGHAVESARINGEIPVDSAGKLILDDAGYRDGTGYDVRPLLHIGTGLDEADPYDLKNPRTYTHTIFLGNAFVYDAVYDEATGRTELQEGILPKLRSEAGVPLAGQKHIYMGASAWAEVLQVAATGDRLAEVYVQHEAGTALTGLKLQWWDAGSYDLTIKPGEAAGLPPTLPGMTVTKFELTMTGLPARRVDAYEIRSVTFEGGEEALVTGEINFPGRWYWEITDADDWQTLMGAHGRTFENFKVSGNIDFSTLSDPIECDLSVNRLEGAAAGGPPPEPLYTIANYTGSVSLVRIVTGEISGLRFANMTVTDLSDDSVGVVGKAQGVAKNLAFERIRISPSGTWRSYVGCFGNITAKTENVKLEDIRVWGASYVGGLAGYGSAGEFKNVRITKVAVLASGERVGGLIGNAQGAEFENCSAVDALVKGGGNYVGGLAGVDSSTKGLNTANPTNRVKNAVIQGNAYVGGLFGQGQTNNVSAHEDVKSVVENAFIRASNEAVGGISGNTTSWWNRGAEVRDSYVFGARAVSGYANGASIKDFYLVNSVVSTNNYRGYAPDNGYDAWRNNFITRQVDAAQNLKALLDEAFAANLNYIPLRVANDDVRRDIGGVNCGTAPQDSCVVAYSFVGGNADYVGGLRGSGGTSTSGRNTNYSLVIGTTVRGINHVGGAIGTLGGGQVVAAAVNADVEGRDYVGGVVGSMGRNLDLTGDSIPVIGAVYFVGKVKATAGRAAGLANLLHPLTPTTGTTTRYPYSNLVAATIDGTNAAFFYNRVAGDDMHPSQHAVFVGSRLNGTTAPVAGAADLVAGDKIVTTADLQNTATWTGLDSYFTEANRTFHYGGLTVADPPRAPNGYMPYRTMRDTWGGNGTITPYQNGRTLTAVPGVYGYNSVPLVKNWKEFKPDIPVKGGIPIPSGSAITIVTMSLMEPASEPQRLPKAEIYAAGGASGLNIEFDAENPDTHFTVKTQTGLVLAESYTERRVFTLDYDFVTPLVVEVSDGHSSEAYPVDPLPLRRSVMLLGDNYHYTDGLGLRDKDNRLLPGDFVNLRDGQALNANGTLYDAVTGLPLPRAPGIASLREEAAPLHRFALGGHEIETYLGFSVSRGADGAESLLPAPAVVKNGALTLIDPGMSDVYDSLICDAFGGEEYLSVLEGGRITDARAPLAVPEEFKNAGLAHFAHNLNTELPYVLARYENGLVNGFNYITGEMLDFESKGDLSLLEYAADYFTSDPDPRESEAARGYMELKPLQEALTVHGLGRLIAGEESGGESDGDGNADGDGPGGADDAAGPGGADDAAGAGEGPSTGQERAGTSTGQERAGAAGAAGADTGAEGQGTDAEAAGETAVTPRGDARGAGGGPAMNGTGAGNGTSTAVGTGAGRRVGEGRPGEAADGEQADETAGQERAGTSTGQERAGTSAGQERAGTSTGQERAGTSAGQEPAGADTGAEGQGADAGAEGQGATEATEATDEIGETKPGGEAATGETAGETAEAAEAGETAGESPGAGEAAAARPSRTGDLAVPSPPEKKTYTAVYDAKTGQYVFYDVDSLLAGGEAEPVLVATEEAKTEAAEILAEAEAEIAETSPTDNPMFGNGIKILLALFVASFLLLYIGLNRRNGRRRA